jgi:hypothetical protein
MRAKPPNCAGFVRVASAKVNLDKLTMVNTVTTVTTVTRVTGEERFMKKQQQSK